MGSSAEVSSSHFRISTSYWPGRGCLYKRVPGGAAWILANQLNQQAPIARPDLPETLQVGLALNVSRP